MNLLRNARWLSFGTLLGLSVACSVGCSISAQDGEGDDDRQGLHRGRVRDDREVSDLADGRWVALAGQGRYGR